jgi:hypothetical protein
MAGSIPSKPNVPPFDFSKLPPPPAKPGETKPTLPPPQLANPPSASQHLSQERVTKIAEDTAGSPPKPASPGRGSSTAAAAQVKGKLKDRLAEIFGFGSSKKEPEEEELFIEHKGAPKVERKTLGGIQGPFESLNECFREYNEVNNFFSKHPEAKNLTSRDLLGGATRFTKPIPEALRPSNKNPMYANALREAARGGKELTAEEILDIWKLSMTDPIEGKLSTEVKFFLEYSKENLPIDEKVLKQKLDRLKKDQISFQKTELEANSDLQKATKERDRVKLVFEGASGDLATKEKAYNEASEKYKKREIDRAPFQKASEEYAEALEDIEPLQSELNAKEKELLDAKSAIKAITEEFLDLANQKVKLENEFDKNGAMQIKAMETRLTELEDKISALTVTK